MNCPRCEKHIVPEFYCINCGFVPLWEPPAIGIRLTAPVTGNDDARSS